MTTPTRRRHLTIDRVPGNFAVLAIGMLIGPFREVVLSMDEEIPDDIKCQARDRNKYRLSLLLVGKSPATGSETPDRFFVCLRLADLIHTPGVGTRIKNYFYVGYVIPGQNYGEVDEYDGDVFTQDEVVRSFFMCEQLPLFRSL